MITASAARERLMERASNDSEFRRSLIEDPKGAVEREFGVTVPEGFSIRVHEQSATEAHVILPPDPQLDENALDRASGGIACSSCAWT